MGFMDRAKKLAEQAQSKLDEVQQQFNEKQGSGAAGADPTRPHVEYDKHGRPVTPPEDRLEPEPGPGRAQGDPADDFPAPPKDKSPSIDPKPDMTSGDPLSGG